MINKLKQANHLGTMRFDFADGEKSIANRWFGYKEFPSEYIPTIQSYVNDIMFNRFNTYSKIVDHCGDEGFEYEKTFTEETEQFLYGIKLIPVRGEYNGYIYVYKKQDEEEVA